MKAAILTLSDKGSRGERADASGPALEAWLKERGVETAQTAIIPDEAELIAARLAEWADSGAFDLILTTGGTGVSPRDVTPDATLTVVERVIPGFGDYVNRHYVAADLKILTGFIEPHMWAGFSGGRKTILPGISSIRTLEFMHGPEMVAHPRTRYGILDGNPFHEAALAVMAQAGADFIVNVTLNTRKEVTGVFAGHPVKAHLEGVAFLSRHCVKTLDEPLDFVVTTNAGAPLDCNLYQTAKGLSGVSGATREGGVILIATECLEGFGSEEYRAVFEHVTTPAEFIAKLMRKEFFIPDQWCAQETYQVMLKNEVWVYTHGIDPETLRRFHFHPVPSIDGAVDELLRRFGPDARWAIVPDGPMVILHLV